MSGNKMNKPPQGNGSKLISKLAAKIGPSAKRTLQPSSSPSGPPPKKSNTLLNSPFNRKTVGEEITKEKKEPKPIFEIISRWKDGVESIKGVTTDFNELSKNAVAGGEDKGKRIEGLILAAIKSYMESDKSDSEILQKLASFIKEQKQHCGSLQIIYALFDLLPVIEAKDFVPAIASALSSIITQLNSYPLQLLKLVINDSCGRRLWTDQTDSIQPYYSIVSIFGGFSIPSSEMYQQAEIPWAKKADYDSEAYPSKFNLSNESLQEVINEAITKISQRCSEEGNKSLIRTLLFMIRNKHIQRASIKKLDTWLQNVKLQRSAMDLLLVFACNISEVESNDIREFLNDLIFMQSFRSKQHLVVLQVSIDILYQRFPSVMGNFIDAILEAEFSPKLKLSHTYTLMHHLCSLNPTEASKRMASRFVQILHQQKSVKQVRAFLREFTKTAFRGNDFVFDEFSRYIFEAVRERVLFSEDFNTTELFKNVVNLCAVLPLSAVVSNIKESGNLRRSGNALTCAQSEVLTKYHGQLRHFMAISVEFLKWAASANLCQDTQAYIDAYHQLLYLGFYKSYNTVGDGWPSEVEYNSVIRIVHECVIDDSILLPLITMNGPTQVGADKILDILEQITHRALSLAPIPSNQAFINVKSIQVFEKLLELSVVDHGESESIKISNKKMYQQSWFLVYKWVILNSKNDNIFKEVYEKYPMLKMLMHMTVINNFHFPIQTFNGKSSREIASVNEVEERTELEIISSIQLLRPIKNESPSNDYSSQDFCLFNPTGPPRNFPELFSVLHNFAKDTIALYLCGIRSPDILGSLAKDKLGDQAMPMIQEAIIKHPSIVENLPIQTLAQLFFYDLLDSDEEKRNVDTGFIRSKLQKSLNEISDAAKEIIKFFLSKLCSHSNEDRHCILKALQILIGDNSTIEHPINAFSKIPLFETISDQICRDLSYSITIESDIKFIMDNISFIAKHMKSGDIHVIALRLTKVVERIGGNSEEHKQVHHALLDFFASYLKSLLSNKTAAFPEADDKNDEILQIKIPQHKDEFNISSKVLTGMMTLLCETSTNTNESNSNRELLLNTWFGNDDKNNQKLHVRRISDNAEVNILPDKLKSKMLASSDERIINAALLGMTVDCALGFLQSSAITASAYSKLLALVNANKPPKGNLRSIAGFVRAYKLRGAQGADEFLNYINEVEGTSTNEHLQQQQQQQQPIQNILVLDPPPTIKHFIATPDIKKFQSGLYSFDSSQAVLEFLKKVVPKASKMMEIITDPNWFSFMKALKNKAFAPAIAEYLINNNSEIPLEFMRIIILTFLDGHRIDNASFKPILLNLALAFKHIPEIGGLLTAFIKEDYVKMEVDENCEVGEEFQEVSSNFTSISIASKNTNSETMDAYFAIVELADATESGELLRIDTALENLKQMSTKIPKVISSLMQVITERVVPILSMSAKKHRDNNFIRLLEFALETVLTTSPFSYENHQCLNLLLRPYLEFFHGRVTYSQRFEKLFKLLVECCLGYIIRNPTAAKIFLNNESGFFKAMQACFNVEALPVLIRQIDDPILIK